LTAIVFAFFTSCKYVLYISRVRKKFLLGVIARKNVQLKNANAASQMYYVIAGAIIVQHVQINKIFK